RSLRATTGTGARAAVARRPEPAVGQGRFADRRAAGRALGERLSGSTSGDPVVLGLPRGGVIVAAEVAEVLGVPLDVLVVRKLGLPLQPELAMGAIAAAGDIVETVRVESVLAAADVPPAAFEEVRRRELEELRRREAAYRAGRPPVVLTGRSVVLVDDGLATGATMRAAVAAVRRQVPLAVTVAVPVGSPRACDELAGDVDEVLCLLSPRWFRAVGQAYADFAATTDEEVRSALERGHRSV
ncbi:MAG TPA: phosphoribosyltransferase family protein, partial [Blastococcus sp.]